MADTSEEYSTDLTLASFSFEDDDDATDVPSVALRNGSDFPESDSGDATNNDPDLELVDYLIGYPEFFFNLPSEKQAFVIYWILFICEFLPLDIENCIYPPDVIQRFAVGRRNYTDYSADLQYLLYATNEKMPGILQIYIEGANNYREKCGSRF
ncbi:hypothetical protein Aperf_G00000078532 [Anoplocephala perfoliata]